MLGNNRKVRFVIRAISIILIASFIAYDLTWAYPDNHLRAPAIVNPIDDEAQAMGRLKFVLTSAAISRHINLANLHERLEVGDIAAKFDERLSLNDGWLVPCKASGSSYGVHITGEGAIKAVYTEKEMASKIPIQLRKSPFAASYHVGYSPIQSAFEELEPVLPDLAAYPLIPDGSNPITDEYARKLGRAVPASVIARSSPAIFPVKVMEHAVKAPKTFLMPHPYMAQDRRIAEAAFGGRFNEICRRAASGDMLPVPVSEEMAVASGSGASTIARPRGEKDSLTWLVPERHPTYTSRVSWWFEQTMALGAGYYAIHGGYGVIAASLIAGATFALPHILRGFTIDNEGRDIFSWQFRIQKHRMPRTFINYDIREALLSLSGISVIALTIGTILTGASFYTFGMWDPFTIMAYSGLAAFHWTVNTACLAAMGVRLPVDEKIKPDVGRRKFAGTVGLALLAIAGLKFILHYRKKEVPTITIDKNDIAALLKKAAAGLREEDAGKEYAADVEAMLNNFEEDIKHSWPVFLPSNAAAFSAIQPIINQEAHTIEPHLRIDINFFYYLLIRIYALEKAVQVKNHPPDKRQSYEEALKLYKAFVRAVLVKESVHFRQCQDQKFFDRCVIVNKFRDRFKSMRQAALKDEAFAGIARSYIAGYIHIEANGFKAMFTYLQRSGIDRNLIQKIGKNIEPIFQEPVRKDDKVDDVKAMMAQILIWGMNIFSEEGAIDPRLLKLSILYGFFGKTSASWTDEGPYLGNKALTVKEARESAALLQAACGWALQFEIDEGRAKENGLPKELAPKEGCPGLYPKEGFLKFLMDPKYYEPEFELKEGEALPDPKKAESNRSSMSGKTPLVTAQEDFKNKVLAELGSCRKKTQGETATAVKIKGILGQLKGSIWKEGSQEETPDKMRIYNETLDWLVNEIYSRMSENHPVLSRAALLKTGSYGRGRAAYRSDVDLMLVAPDRFKAEPGKENAEQIEMNRALESFSDFVKDAFAAFMLIMNPKMIAKQFEDYSAVGSSETELKIFKETCTKYISAKFFAGDDKFYNDTIKPLVYGKLRQKADIIIKQLILERNNRYMSDKWHETYKFGLGGVREWDMIEWLLELNGYAGGRSRIDPSRLEDARGSYYRQAYLRDRGTELAKLGEAEQIQYVRDAIRLFDLLVEVMRLLWRGEPKDLPIFLASGDWKTKLSDGDIAEMTGALTAAEQPIQTRIVPYNEEISEVVIAVKDDRVGLLAGMSGVLAANKANIQSARIQSPHGGVFNHFWVKGLPKVKAAEERFLQELDRDLKAVFLQGKTVKELFNEKGIEYSFPFMGPPGDVPTVIFIKDAPNGQALTFLTQERAKPGLFHLITQWLADQEINIVESGTIRTEANVIFDSLVITERDGSRLSAKRCQDIEAGLKAFLAPPSPTRTIVIHRNGSSGTKRDSINSRESTNGESRIPKDEWMFAAANLRSANLNIREQVVSDLMLKLFPVQVMAMLPEKKYPKLWNLVKEIQRYERPSFDGHPRIITRQALEEIEDRQAPIIEHREFFDELEAVPGTISEAEKKILISTFGLFGAEEANNVELGRHFRLSLERIEQIGDKAVRKFRHPVRARRLEPFFGMRIKPLELFSYTLSSPFKPGDWHRPQARLRKKPLGEEEKEELLAYVRSLPPEQQKILAAALRGKGEPGASSDDRRRLLGTLRTDFTFGLLDRFGTFEEVRDNLISLASEKGRRVGRRSSSGGERPENGDESAQQPLDGIKDVNDAARLVQQLMVIKDVIVRKGAVTDDDVDRIRELIDKLSAAALNPEASKDDFLTAVALYLDMVKTQTFAGLGLGELYKITNSLRESSKDKRSIQKMSWLIHTCKDEIIDRRMHTVRLDSHPLNVRRVINLIGSLETRGAMRFLKELAAYLLRDLTAWVIINIEQIREMEEGGPGSLKAEFDYLTEIIEDLFLTSINALIFYDKRQKNPATLEDVKAEFDRRFERLKSLWTDVELPDWMAKRFEMIRKKAMILIYSHFPNEAIPVELLDGIKIHRYHIRAKRYSNGSKTAQVSLDSGGSHVVHFSPHEEITGVSRFLSPRYGMGIEIIGSKGSLRRILITDGSSHCIDGIAVGDYYRLTELAPGKGVYIESALVRDQAGFATNFAAQASLKNIDYLELKGSTLAATPSGLIMIVRDSALKKANRLVLIPKKGNWISIDMRDVNDAMKQYFNARTILEEEAMWREAFPYFVDEALIRLAALEKAKAKAGSKERVEALEFTNSKVIRYLAQAALEGGVRERASFTKEEEGRLEHLFFMLQELRIPFFTSLLRFLFDTDLNARKVGAWALGNLSGSKDANILNALRTCLKSEQDDTVRPFIERAVARIGDRRLSRHEGERDSTPHAKTPPAEFRPNRDSTNGETQYKVEPGSGWERLALEIFKADNRRGPKNRKAWKVYLEGLNALEVMAALLDSAPEWIRPALRKEDNMLIFSKDNISAILKRHITISEQTRMNKGFDVTFSWVKEVEDGLDDQPDPNIWPREAIGRFNAAKRLWDKGARGIQIGDKPASYNYEKLARLIIESIAEGGDDSGIVKAINPAGTLILFPANAKGLLERLAPGEVPDLIRINVHTRLLNTAFRTGFRLRWQAIGKLKNRFPRVKRVMIDIRDHADSAGGKDEAGAAGPSRTRRRRSKYPGDAEFESLLQKYDGDAEVIAKTLGVTRYAADKWKKARKVSKFVREPDTAQKAAAQAADARESSAGGSAIIDYRGLEERMKALGAFTQEQFMATSAALPISLIQPEALALLAKWVSSGVIIKIDDNSYSFVDIYLKDKDGRYDEARIDKAFQSLLYLPHIGLSRGLLDTLTGILNHTLSPFGGEGKVAIPLEGGHINGFIANHPNYQELLSQAIQTAVPSQKERLFWLFWLLARVYEAYAHRESGALRQDGYQKAAAFLELAILIKPDYLQVKSDYGLILSRLKRFQEAEKVFGEIMNQGEVRTSSLVDHAQLKLNQATQIQEDLAVDLKKDQVNAGQALERLKGAETLIGQARCILNNVIKSARRESRTAQVPRAYSYLTWSAVVLSNLYNALAFRKDIEEIKPFGPLAFHEAVKALESAASGLGRIGYLKGKEAQVTAVVRHNLKAYRGAVSAVRRASKKLYENLKPIAISPRAEAFLEDSARSYLELAHSLSQTETDPKIISDMAAVEKNLNPLIRCFQIREMVENTLAPAMRKAVLSGCDTKEAFIGCLKDNLKAAARAQTPDEEALLDKFFEDAIRPLKFDMLDILALKAYMLNKDSITNGMEINEFIEIVQGEALGVIKDEQDELWKMVNDEGLTETITLKFKSQASLLAFLGIPWPWEPPEEVQAQKTEEEETQVYTSFEDGLTNVQMEALKAHDAKEYSEAAKRLAQMRSRLAALSPWFTTQDQQAVIARHNRDVQYYESVLETIKEEMNKVAGILDQFLNKEKRRGLQKAKGHEMQRYWRDETKRSLELCGECREELRRFKNNVGHEAGDISRETDEKISDVRRALDETKQLGMGFPKIQVLEEYIEGLAEIEETLKTIAGYQNNRAVSLDESKEKRKAFESIQAGVEGIAGVLEVLKPLSRDIEKTRRDIEDIDQLLIHSKTELSSRLDRVEEYLTLAVSDPLNRKLLEAKILSELVDITNALTILLGETYIIAECSKEMERAAHLVEEIAAAVRFQDEEYIMQDGRTLYSSAASAKDLISDVDAAKNGISPLLDEPISEKIKAKLEEILARLKTANEKLFYETSVVMAERKLFIRSQLKKVHGPFGYMLDQLHQKAHKGFPRAESRAEALRHLIGNLKRLYLGCVYKVEHPGDMPLTEADAEKFQALSDKVAEALRWAVRDERNQIEKPILEKLVPLLSTGFIENRLILAHDEFGLLYDCCNLRIPKCIEGGSDVSKNMRRFTSFWNELKFPEGAICGPIALEAFAVISSAIKYYMRLYAAAKKERVASAPLIVITILENTYKRVIKYVRKKFAEKNDSLKSDGAITGITVEYSVKEIQVEDAVKRDWQAMQRLLDSPYIQSYQFKDDPTRDSTSGQSRDAFQLHRDSVSAPAWTVSPSTDSRVYQSRTATLQLPEDAMGVFKSDDGRSFYLVWEAMGEKDGRFALKEARGPPVDFDDINENEVVTRAMTLPVYKTEEEIAGTLYFVRFVRPGQDVKIVDDEKKARSLQEVEFNTLHSLSLANDIYRKVDRYDVALKPVAIPVNIDIFPSIVPGRNEPVIRLFLEIMARYQAKLNAKFRGNVRLSLITINGQDGKLKTLQGMYEEALRGLGIDLKCAPPENSKQGFLVTNIDEKINYSGYHVLPLETALRDEGSAYALSGILDLAVSLSLMLNNNDKRESYAKIREVYSNLAQQEITDEILDVILGPDQADSRILSMKLKIRPMAQYNLNDLKDVYERMRDVLKAA